MKSEKKILILHIQVVNKSYKYFNPCLIHPEVGIEVWYKVFADAGFQGKKPGLGVRNKN